MSRSTTTMFGVGVVSGLLVGLVTWLLLSAGEAVSLGLVFLLLGSALVAGGVVLFSAASSAGLRSVAAAAVAPGGLMALIGLVNALSGTL